MMRENGRKKPGSKKWVFGSVLIFGIVLFLCLYSMGENSVYFYTPKELIEKRSELQGKEIRVGGMVKVASVDWKPQKLDLSFTLSDLKGSELKVSYKGAPPDMFKEGSGVVVEGLFSEGSDELMARNLFVKHSEEYRIPEESHKVDPSLIEKSILK